MDGYGRVLVPKHLRAFPPEFCHQWDVHAKRQGISEGNISKLMEFFNEEVEGALIAQKIRGGPWTTLLTLYPRRSCTSTPKKYDRDVRTDAKTNNFVCFARRRVTGPKNARL